MIFAMVVTSDDKGGIYHVSKETLEILDEEEFNEVEDVIVASSTRDAIKALVKIL